MGSTSSVSFSGLSTYAKDFEQVLQRAVAIASLPLTIYNQRATQYNDELEEYQTLSKDFSSVETALTAVSSALGTSSYTAYAEDTKIAVATASSGALAGTYTLEVTDAGKQTEYMSTSAFSNSAAPGTYTLKIGTNPDVTITQTGTDMTSLAKAINDAKAGVQASVVNVGSSSTPDYRLTLKSDGLEDIAMSLQDSSSNELMSVTTHGTPAVYIVNGQTSNPISSKSSTVTIAPNVSVTIQGAGKTTIHVTRSTGALASALSSLASAYNTAMKELRTNRGQAGGALAGKREVSVLESELRQIVQYTAPGNGTSLIGLGLSFDQNGVASFDSSKLTTDSLATAEAFFGTTSTTGFLKNAHTLMNNITDVEHGVIPSAMDSLQELITHTDDRINATIDRVDLLERSLTNKLQQADSAVYALQQQATYFTNLFEAMRTAQKMYAS